MMNKYVIGGNWKMNLGITQSISTAEEMIKKLKNVKNTEIFIAPSYTSLVDLGELFKGTNIHLAAQNMSEYDSGAYTGEVSAGMIKSTGSTYVIIGHSERRTLFGENNSVLSRKAHLAIEAGLKVIFCCGEVLPERETGKHFEVVRKQLSEGIFDFNAMATEDIVIAYEPVWAIGTGLTATPDQAQEMHSYIRSLIEKKYGKKVSDAMSILYGGSCKPSNAAEIFAKPDVDGGLIGGASLTVEDFCAIVDSV